jgi:hypothetical protein
MRYKNKEVAGLAVKYEISARNRGSTAKISSFASCRKWERFKATRFIRPSARYLGLCGTPRYRHPRRAIETGESY